MDREFNIGLIPIIAICVTIYMVAGLFKNPEVNTDYEHRITKLEQYKTSTEPIISGLNDEILELRHITDEFRAQIKGLQKEVLIGIQEGYNGQ